METHNLLTSLAIVAGLLGVTAANIESYGPVEPPIPFKPWWNEETPWSGSLASPHIVGGKEAIPHSHPHQVALLIKKKGAWGEEAEYMCGGSLLSDLWVVTAAHCVDVWLTVTVIIGAHDISDVESENVQQVNASKIILHEQWTTSVLINDIALLKLEKSVILDGKFAKSIRLPKLSEKTESFKGSTVTISGWGRTDSNSYNLPTKLQTADLEVIGNFYCKIRYLFLMVRDTNICTSTRSGKDSCQGDSGGPMIVKEADGEPTLIGITSFGIGCNWIFPGVYTRATSYLDWIHKNTNIVPRN